MAKSIFSKPSYLFVIIRDKYTEWRTDNGFSGSDPTTNTAQVNAVLRDTRKRFDLNLNQVEIRDERNQRNPRGRISGILADHARAIGKRAAKAVGRRVHAAAARKLSSLHSRYLANPIGRKFKISADTKDGVILKTVSGNTAHAAAKKFIEDNLFGYRFTGALRNDGPNLWRGEAYNDTHGAVIHVRDMDVNPYRKNPARRKVRTGAIATPERIALQLLFQGQWLTVKYFPVSKAGNAAAKKLATEMHKKKGFPMRAITAAV